MITLYTTGCPKCRILAKKLKDKSIAYAEVTDVDEMLRMGMSEVPVLEVEGERMSFGEAVKWVNNYKEEEIC